MKIFFTFILLVFTYTASFSQSIFSKHKEPISKLDKENDTLQFKAWTDKNTYKANDTITLVIEANRDFELVTKIEVPNVQKQMTSSVLSYKNDKTWHYYSIRLKALKKGTITIPSFKIVVEEKKYNTKKITITILK